MADYGEPSMVGTDTQDDTEPRTNTLNVRELMQIHHLLDLAGVDVGGDAVQRIQALISRSAAEIKPNYTKTSEPMTSDRDMPEDIWTRQQEIEARVTEITAWWYDHAANVIDRSVPKAAEYGAADLDLMGKTMETVYATQLKGTDRDFQEQFGRYAACAFYLQGKIARIFGALERGVLPNPDSEFDIEVYAVMLDRIREFGRWV